MMAFARRILVVVEDGVLQVLGDHLAATDNLTLIGATTLRDAADKLDAAYFDALLLDTHLSDGNGIEFCAMLRRLGYKMPIIMLGDGATDFDIIQGLDAGANDFAILSTRPKEILARLRAQLRVLDGSLDATLMIGSLEFRPAEKLLLSSQTNRRVSLTTKEAELFRFLHGAAGSYVTRQLLLSKVWGYKTGVESKTVDTHAYRLRKKVGSDSGCGLFFSVQNGYRLDTILHHN